MNNFVIGLKRFFTNKNVVTIILILVILVVLYWGYSSSIKSQTEPVNLPVAAHTIHERTEITSEDVTYKRVANSMLNDKVIRNSAAIIGKYTTVGSTVPEGSPFYSEVVVDADKVPGNWIEELNHSKGELGYYMSVDVESTLGNSVLPNTYIDIYMKANDENGTVMFGKLLKNIKVLVAHDGSGNNVFGNENNGSVSKIGFAVDSDTYILLHKAEYLNLDLIIAPRGSTAPRKEGIVVTSSTLRDYIDAQTITVEEDVIEEKATACTTKDNKYYDKDGKEVTKTEYEKSCKETKVVCTMKDNKYYDKDGKEVTKAEYEKSCNS